VGIKIPLPLARTCSHTHSCCDSRKQVFTGRHSHRVHTYTPYATTTTHLHTTRVHVHMHLHTPWNTLWRPHVPSSSGVQEGGAWRGYLSPCSPSACPAQCICSRVPCPSGRGWLSKGPSPIPHCKCSRLHSRILTDALWPGHKTTAEGPSSLHPKLTCIGHHLCPSCPDTLGDRWAGLPCRGRAHPAERHRHSIQGCTAGGQYTHTHTHYTHTHTHLSHHIPHTPHTIHTTYHTHMPHTPHTPYTHTKHHTYIHTHYTIHHYHPFLCIWKIPSSL
jgi:hypothetical protein